MARREQVLYRDTDEKMIGGVCSGLGRYFDVDTMLVRVAFVVAAMLGGGGILGYVILWVVLDPATTDYWDELAKDQTVELELTDRKDDVVDEADEADAVDLTDPETTDAAHM